eukprot:CAMPEP_0184688208 /NCGR_PEP_ID=MMETSP0312-20130426/28972_1 /TAXON_ID=31354 /ORGANISM="Compsopogon coeruleus, Strain SAG 36.94" /LENGTH=52 /DNA_ID=CAMNT_0027145093 /DNA_START=25 /DNA_END=180 /DNA_ORIENTATION=+
MSPVGFPLNEMNGELPVTTSDIGFSDNVHHSFLHEDTGLQTEVTMQGIHDLW